jgi:hypothetical protein
MEVDEGIPEESIWFDPDDFRELLNDWLLDYSGVMYAEDLMDKAHGDWTKRKVS